MTPHALNHDRSQGSGARPWLTRLLALLLTLLLASAAWGEPRSTLTAPPRAAEGSAPVMLQLFNRDITELRGILGGLDAAQRVSRAQAQFSAWRDSGVADPIKVVPLSLTEGSGYLFQLESQHLFTLMSADLDPEERMSLKDAAERVRLRLEEAVAALRAQQSPMVWLKGLGVIAVSLLLSAGGIWGVRRLHVALKQRADAATSGTGAVSYLIAFSLRVLGAAVWLPLAALLYGEAIAMLTAFPWSEPWGDALADFVREFAAWLITGIFSAIPGLFTIAVILLLARTVQDLLRMFLSRVQSGNIQVPFMHGDTVGATRILLNAVIWGLALAVAYPYLPGSSSDAFKGVSVFFGLMITLGSSGLMTQLMSGLVVVYSRSLRKGDFVAINGVEGVVSEIGALAIKVITIRNEEITMPHAVIAGSPIRNYSKLAAQQGTLISTKVTIGYDAPWRQVHALLIEAAKRTAGVRNQPEPFVYQRALSDFYVEYELFAHINAPLQRVPILSALHGEIQDEFNAHGVQIMSPHFFDQPAQAVVVPPDKWHEPPARPPGPGAR